MSKESKECHSLPLVPLKPSLLACLSTQAQASVARRKYLGAQPPQTLLLNPLTASRSSLQLHQWLAPALLLGQPYGAKQRHERSTVFCPLCLLVPCAFGILPVPCISAWPAIKVGSRLERSGLVGSAAFWLCAAHILGHLDIRPSFSASARLTNRRG